MAKITPEQRAFNARLARFKVVRYLAFTGNYSYNDVSDFAYECGYRKMDATEATKYYVEKRWMTGEPLKLSSRNTCRLEPMWQCAVIAYTDMIEMDYVLKNAKEVHPFYSYRQKGEENFCDITRALNVYCRAFPETLNAFPESIMDDFPISRPSESETAEARSKWGQIKAEFLTNDLGEIPFHFLNFLVLLRPFKEFFLSLPALHFIDQFVTSALNHESLLFLNDEQYDYAMEMLNDITVQSPIIKFKDALKNNLIVCQHFLLHGDIEGHLSQLHGENNGSCCLRAIAALQDNRPDDAFKIMDSYLKNKKNILFDDPLYDYFYGLSILLSGKPDALKKAEVLLKKKDIKENSGIPYFRLLLQMKAHPETDFEKWIPANLNNSHNTHLGAALFSLLCVHYGYCGQYKISATSYAQQLISKNIKVLALDFAKDLEIFRPQLSGLQKDTKMHPLLPEDHKLEPWESVLNAMLMKFDVAEASSSRKKPVAQEMARVVYEVNLHNNNVQPRLQKSKDGGVTWSGGRNIALKNFQKGIPEMTPQDSRVALLVETYSYGWYGGTVITLSGANVIEALIGHPYVFDAQNVNIKLEILSEKLQIQVKESPKGYEVSYNVEKNYSGTYDSISIHHENAQLVKVIRLSSEEKEILSMFDRIGTFPKSAKEKLTQLLGALGKKVTVMSTLLKNVENVKQKKGDSKLTVQLVPYGDVFTVRCFVKPLSSCPPYCTPGKGLEFIAANVKGETIHVARNLAAEKKNMKAFNELMEPFDEYSNDDSWQMPMESCLEVLDLLRLHQDVCSIEWPEGVKFSVARPALMPEDIRLSVKGIGHWFEVDGEVKIDDKQKLKVSELLKRVRDAKGRFIQIGDAEYMALSQQLQKQLSALNRILQSDRKQLRIAPYNSSFLQDLVSSGVSAKMDKSYTQMLERMDEADSMKISVPKTLQADLRDYQKDGYRWLCRLAHWGAGACLADDMGLGKTIQTISLLLARAKEGASLVVMPTSVLINWHNELSRFAPSLNAIILRDAADRKEAISKAGAQDVVLATYGLLPTEEEALHSKQWNIIVLDEAHTIKNKDTKTSHAAMSLEGKFRLLLTGTPLQNHLSEIWNLFQFATPGLLAGYAQFTQEFINPIEKDHNKDAQRLLKRMLQPFILRRTKSEVLNELPEKTEITLKVELSDAERALYDRFREEAVLNLEEGSTSAIKALAELTRLRQTVCNPALVLPAKEAKDIPSSKMEAFLKLVEELMRNHHRALVFSQFTSHLALVQKELKRLNISYQYLDGSVSPTERIARVADFQKGDQPLFLISLKAGGTGLNLTAADYVIHLDPWWNPAIEDQASDRAYRIGQDKPVTVYRLIAENTIEEKIIALHQTKKSLADALLEGSDMAHTLGKDEILNLIRGI